MRPWIAPIPTQWRRDVDLALWEDLGHGDLSAVCFAEDHTVSWFIEAQAEGIVCGVGIGQHLLQPPVSDDGSTTLACHANDGDLVHPGTRILSGVSPAAHVLSAERTALNYLMHLSGVASLTRRFVQEIEGTKAKIVDTRKTIPGLRSLQKYAVRCGGGFNHRMGLFDSVMIKDNHIASAGSIEKALARARASVSHVYRIEVECESLAQVSEAIDAGADIVMLDNMTPALMKRAVEEHQGRCLFEASGGVTLESVRSIALSGVDLISVGALTHSAPALSLHLEVIA